MRRRERQPYYANYKLYAHEVIDIHYMVKTTDIPQREIADHYGISMSHVSNIGAKRFWREVLGGR